MQVGCDTAKGNVSTRNVRRGAERVNEGVSVLAAQTARCLSSTNRHIFAKRYSHSAIVSSGPSCRNWRYSGMIANTVPAPSLQLMYTVSFLSSSQTSRQPGRGRSFRFQLLLNKLAAEPDAFPDYFRLETWRLLSSSSRRGSASSDPVRAIHRMRKYSLTGRSSCRAGACGDSSSI